MSFDVALSGIRAASSDLSITGNNIANASTTGFKSSRAEFGDVYATSVMGAGNKPIGSGVQLQDVSQNFTQGNVTFTENELDLAISGNGFFVVRRDGAQYYTRAGTFGLDRDGYVTSNTGARLQGFPVNGRGQITGIQNDIRIQANNIAPRATTAVESVLNLDSSEPVLQSVGTRFATEGNSIGIARSGLAQSTRTTYESPIIDLQNNPIDLTNPADSIEFDVQLAGSSGNNGTVHITLDSTNVPAQISSYNDLRSVVSEINAQLFQQGSQVDVVASVVQLGNNQYQLQFTSVQQGENSEITISNGSGLAGDLQLPVGAATATSNPGVPAANNGYPRQSIDIVDSKGDVVTYTSAANASAATIASELNAISGVTATATTTMRFVSTDFDNASGTMQVRLNGVNLSASSLEEMEQAINRLTTSTLPGITAAIDETTGDLMVRSSVGDNLRVSVTGDVNDSIGIIGAPGTPMTALSPSPDNEVVVGGQLEIVLAEGYSATNANPQVGLFDQLNATAFSEVVLNAFDPSDKNTYNHATSLKIFDSLGNPHVMTQYFVRQEYNPNDPTTSPNEWIMYVQVDGQEVGEPNTTLPPPQNTMPTRAAFTLQFNPDGSLNRNLSDQVLISNWTPLDSAGNPNGALGPQNILAGGTMNIPDPPTSSNFTIDLAGTTQFSSVFSVNDVDQNGYTTGRLSGLNIDETGIIFARFTNGESMVLGQVILANFTNNQGLQPVGDSMWVENYESGPPNIGTPGSATLGSIQSGALEESNVDLSEELVRLIIAQRNFQASAKTIETTNQVTQTVINLR